MIEFLSETFSNNIILAVMIVSMLPAIESKIAIPFAMSAEIWGTQALSPWVAFGVSFVGSMIPAFFLFFLARKIKNKTSGFVLDRFFSKFTSQNKTYDKIEKHSSIWKKCFLLASFIAIPFPMTGVFTGSLIAGFVDMKAWQAFVTIAIGEFFSCLIIMLLCTTFNGIAIGLLTFFLCVIALMLFVGLMKNLLAKRKTAKS